MHLNINKVRRGDKVHCYARLVESYRRKKDGKPTIRVLANLGKLSEREIENFRLALAASREGTALVSAHRTHKPSFVKERFTDWPN